MIAFLAALIEDRRLALMTLGSLCVIGGAIAPWAIVASPLRPITESGLDADGKLTILCGVASLGLIVAYWRLRQRDLVIASALVSLAALVMAVLYAINVRRASARVVARLLDVAPAGTGSGFAVRTGVGVWLTIVGALVMVLPTILLVLDPKPDAADSA